MKLTRKRFNAIVRSQYDCWWFDIAMTENLSDGESVRYTLSGRVTDDQAQVLRRIKKQFYRYLTLPLLNDLYRRKVITDKNVIIVME